MVRENFTNEKKLATEIFLNSPRARRVLFMFLSAKGLLVVSIVEFSQEFKNPFLTNTAVAVFSETDVKDGYPL